MAAGAGDPNDLLVVGRRAAEQAASALVEGLRRTRASVETKSTGTDMVTEMDRAAERLIVERILHDRPDDGIIGEEGTDRDGTSRVRWIIDPIDGTTNYLYGMPGFAVSIAAAVDDEVVAAVVVDPLHGDVFTATLGAGAARNGERMRVSAESRLGHALIGTGFSYEPARRALQGAVLQQILPEIRDVRRSGAASVDLCSVACGRLDGFYEKGLAPWDHAAGGLIVTEAGGRLGDLEGGRAGGHFLLATNGALFDPLAGLLRSAGAAYA
jgi:myo-inositol-1(or 4)-monophosphatase